MSNLYKEALLAARTRLHEQNPLGAARLIATIGALAAGASTEARPFFRGLVWWPTDSDPLAKVMLRATRVLSPGGYLGVKTGNGYVSAKFWHSEQAGSAPGLDTLNIMFDVGQGMLEPTNAYADAAPLEMHTPGHSPRWIPAEPEAAAAFLANFGIVESA